MIRQAKPKIGRGVKPTRNAGTPLTALGVKKKLNFVFASPAEVTELRNRYIANGLIKTLPLGTNAA